MNSEAATPTISTLLWGVEAKKLTMLPAEKMPTTPRQKIAKKAIMVLAIASNIE